MTEKKITKIKIHNMPFGGFWIDPKDIILSDEGQKIIKQIAKISIKKTKDKSED